jgi:dGTPase
MLKLYASIASKSRGRLYQEGNTNRTPFQRDRDRIIHSASFRRLEYKTQVFVNSEGDHFRTRLTHTLEVAQIARAIAQRLGLDIDLTETIALAHDLGHPPFGHAGEDVLNNLMQDYGGFNHNEHVIKLLTCLEHKYIAFKGLNLTYETLEGIIKHNGPILQPSGYIAALHAKFDLNLDLQPSLEAQIASLADDIAYNNHDIDDGFRAGILKIEDFKEVDAIYSGMLELKSTVKDIERGVLVHETLRKLYSQMINDLVITTKGNLEQYKMHTLADIQNHNGFIAGFSPKMSAEIAKIKQILYTKLYRHSSIEIMCDNAKTVITTLFNNYLANPDIFAKALDMDIDHVSKAEYMTLLCDYIAGMTDRYAEKQTLLHQDPS